MKSKKEEACAILTELGDVAEDTEEVKMFLKWSYATIKPFRAKKV